MWDSVIKHAVDQGTPPLILLAIVSFIMAIIALWRALRSVSKERVLALEKGLHSCMEKHDECEERNRECERRANDLHTRLEVLEERFRAK